MTDEEKAEEYVDALLDKDDAEIDKFLDENLGDLQLNERQAGTLLGIIKGIGICSFLAGLKASGYNTAVSKYKRQNGELTDKVKELEAQIEKMKCLLNEIYSEYGFSELVKIRNNLPIEIQEVIKEIKEND